MHAGSPGSSDVQPRTEPGPRSEPRAIKDRAGLMNCANDDVGYAAEDRDGYERAGGQVPNLGFCVVVHRGFSRWPPAYKT
jgi:hypothetical protein